MVHPAKPTPEAALWAALALNWKLEAFMGSINVHYEQSIGKVAGIFKTHSYTYGVTSLPDLNTRKA